MIRLLFIILFFMTYMPLLLHANVDAQIEAIKKASVKERFKLMNEFKKNIIKMKEKERIEAMVKITVESDNPQAKKVLHTLQEHAKRKEIQLQMETHHLGESGILSSLDDQEGDYDD